MAGSTVMTIPVLVFYSYSDASSPDCGAVKDSTS
ncbi:hypothetical protein SALBM311S_07620 [Streptomyces alboniger]